MKYFKIYYKKKVKMINKFLHFVFYKRRTLVKQPNIPFEYLQDCLHYSLNSGGKRLRSIFVLESTFASFNSNFLEYKTLLFLSLSSAIAIEGIHVYSLIHDDLPCMDNSYFRRNVLSSHVKFNEFSSILLGNALIFDAFNVLSLAKINASRLSYELSLSSGSFKLIVGQFSDLLSKKDSFFELIYLNRLKTAVLFSTSCVLGVVAANANEIEIKFFRLFGYWFGQLYQSIDDMLDNKYYVFKGKKWREYNYLFLRKCIKNLEDMLMVMGKRGLFFYKLINLLFMKVKVKVNKKHIKR